MLSLIFIVSLTIFKIFSFFLGCDILIFGNFAILTMFTAHIFFLLIITTVITITRPPPPPVDTIIIMVRKTGPSTNRGVVVGGGDVVVVVVLVVDGSEMTGSTYFMHLSMISLSSWDGCCGGRGGKNVCNWSICSIS